MRWCMWTAALVAAGIFLAAPSAQAQDRFSLDVRGGVGIPTDDPGQSELETGAGLDASVGVRILPHLWIYGGWGWHHFSADAVAWGTDTELEQTGYRYGLRWEHPLTAETEGGLSVMLHAGGTWEHLEVEDADGELVTDTDHGAGWEAGAGLAIPIWAGWRLTPGARYRSLSRELLFEDLRPEVHMGYVAVEVGLSRTF